MQCLIGGTNINAEVGALKRSRADILIAVRFIQFPHSKPTSHISAQTPGRLKDHLENYGLAPKLGQLTTLIFDEADRLLDAGFKADIDRILGLLPDRASQPRQTLMFSATISEDVKKVYHFILSLHSSNHFPRSSLELLSPIISLSPPFLKTSKPPMNMLRKSISSLLCRTRFLLSHSFSLKKLKIQTQKSLRSSLPRSKQP